MEQVSLGALSGIVRLPLVVTVCDEAPCHAALSELKGRAMRIAMVGSGYVGLTSGACLAQFGHDVICIDKVADKVASLRKGNIPIYEPGLDKLVVDNVRAGRLAFDTSLAEAVGNADAVFIAVGTPTGRGDGHADLTYVRSAAAEIAEALRGYT